MQCEGETFFIKLYYMGTSGDPFGRSLGAWLCREHVFHNARRFEAIPQPLELVVNAQHARGVTTKLGTVKDISVGIHALISVTHWDNCTN